MTPKDRALVVETFPLVEEVAGPLSVLFYGRLFELDPSLRRMFRQDAAVQGRKLMEMLAATVDHLGDIKSFAPALRAMGQRHVGYGVKPEHYDTVKRALLWALAKSLDRAFSPELRSAWSQVIDVISAHMKDGAAQK